MAPLPLFFLQKKSSGPIPRIGIKAIHVHPKFNITGDLDSDVAILKLSTAVPDSPHVEYATLPPAGSDPAGGTTMTVAGWYVSVCVPFLFLASFFLLLITLDPRP